MLLNVFASRSIIFITPSVNKSHSTYSQSLLEARKRNHRENSQSYVIKVMDKRSDRLQCLK